ncbi:MAG TPA: divalent-cation tolerance protein CutA [Dehalococcoidia bacterium]|nr:divalent-cation tolerance protein CutA [Dehalococcoidia bacterium]
MSAAPDHDPNGDYCVVFTTCASGEDAGNLATTLLRERLAACVQVVDIKSYYVWNDEHVNEPEKLLLIKTRADLYPAIEATLGRVHPYETPEIVCLPVVAGSPDYLRWIDGATKEAV